MQSITMDCQFIKDEASFWLLYLEVVKPEGAHLFGRNIAAFWDAISAGGPGWPGEAVVVFSNAAFLCRINAGHLLKGLQEIASKTEQIRVVMAAA